MKSGELEKLNDYQLEILDRQARWKNYQLQPNSKTFAELILKDDSTGDRISLEPIHIEWHNFIDKCLSMGKKRIGIMSPFEHGKTTWCLGMALKYLVDDPSTRITFVCNSDDNAIKRVSTLGSYIDEDKDFKTFFGDRVKRDQKRSWTDHKLYLERHTRAIDPSIEARGLTTKGAGSRIDVLILDDICDIDDTYSEAKRKKGIAQLRGLWLHRVTQHGIAICIATAYHQEDAVHWLVDNPEWSFLIQRISENFKEIEQIEVIR